MSENEIEKVMERPAEYKLNWLEKHGWEQKYGWIIGTEEIAEMYEEGYHFAYFEEKYAPIRKGIWCQKENRYGIICVDGINEALNWELEHMED